MRSDLPDHDGSTYSRPLDKSRLNAQQHRVWNAMRDGRWYTLDEVAALTCDPPASVSARIRDFRKEKFGGFTVERRRVHERLGWYEYRLIVPPEQMALNLHGNGQPRKDQHVPD